MRLSSLLCAAAVSAALTGAASAGMIQNGNFASTSLNGNPVTVPTEFGTGVKNGFTSQQFITGWQGNDGYEIWYPNAWAAANVNATGEWTGTGKEMLYPTISAPPGGGAFVGLDGDQTTGVQSSIGQWVTGLTAGGQYTVTFNWGGSQMQSRTGATTEYLAVSLGSQTLDTNTLSNVSGGFTGWKNGSLTFTATSGTEWLNFLSVGTPTGYPPMAVLTNVSMSTVPEPASLALFGAGLLGLGVALVSRRRAQRDRL